MLEPPAAGAAGGSCERSRTDARDLAARRSGSQAVQRPGGLAV
ncbi:hypothetical protein OG730_22800 [Streptomyces sp. NBC_01298]|nr:hypothetical protein OG730_22800 [Streptomyces sp. NBC_01298]